MCYLTGIFSFPDSNMAFTGTNSSYYTSDEFGSHDTDNLFGGRNASPGDYYSQYDFYEYYEYSEHIYEIFKFETPIYGYIWPVIVLITAGCNILVIAMFLRKRMRNATNMILVSIAVSDSLTGLVTLPATIHVFSMDNLALSKQWCEVTMLTRLFIARAFHTASVWQTLLLGIHRYVQLRGVVNAPMWISPICTGISIILVYVFSFLLHLYHAFDVKTENGMCSWELERPCVSSCIYIWCAFVFGHLIPCIVLLCLTYGMVKRLRTLDSRCHTCIESTRQSRKNAEQNRILTKTVIAIVVLFLIPEFPYGIFYLITLSLRHAGKMILPLKTNRLIHCLYEVLLVLSFHLNFWVYCLIIRNFRTGIKRVIQMATCKTVHFERASEGTTSSDIVELQAMRSETAVIENDDTINADTSLTRIGTAM